MKKTYILLAALLAVCTAFPAAAKIPAGSKMANAITRKIVAQHKKHHAKKTAAEVCAACGQAITEATQHCTAKDCNGLCSAHAEQPAAHEPETDQASICPTCGQAYTIDEKYHGTPHVCAPAKKAKKDNGVIAGGNGGEPECGVIFIESPDQEEYQGGNGGEPETTFFVVESDEKVSIGGNGGEPEGPYYEEIDEEAYSKAEQLWRADKKANGKPKHSMEYYYKQVTSKNK